MGRNDVLGYRRNLPFVTIFHLCTQRTAQTMVLECYEGLRFFHFSNQFDDNFLFYKNPFLKLSFSSITYDVNNIYHRHYVYMSFNGGYGVI
jgi:hypothetical protein